MGRRRHASDLKRRQEAEPDYTPGPSAEEKIGPRPYTVAAEPIRPVQPGGGRSYTIGEFPSPAAYGRWVQRGRLVSPAGEPVLEPQDIKKGAENASRIREDERQISQPRNAVESGES